MGDLIRGRICCWLCWFVDSMVAIEANIQALCSNYFGLVVCMSEVN